MGELTPEEKHKSDQIQAEYETVGWLLTQEEGELAVAEWVKEDFATRSVQLDRGHWEYIVPIIAKAQLAKSERSFVNEKVEFGLSVNESAWEAATKEALLAKSQEDDMCGECLGKKEVEVDCGFEGFRIMPCRTCQGTSKKHTPECIKHKAIFGSVGCTCQGTSKKPERETLAKHLWETKYPKGNTWEQMETGNSPTIKIYLEKADRLLALLPDENKIRKQADQKGYLRGVNWATKVAEDALDKVYKAHEEEIVKIRKQERSDNCGLGTLL